jgi:hypothetical protein
LIAPRSKRGGGIIAVIVAVVLGLAVSCNGFREDEIECEQAVVHLRECCPDLNIKTLDCSYEEHLDCSDTVTSREYPALALDDSRCVQKKSCDQLVASGACGRAGGAKRRRINVDVDAGASSKTPDSVCTP